MNERVFQAHLLPENTMPNDSSTGVTPEPGTSRLDRQADGAKPTRFSSAYTPDVSGGQAGTIPSDLSRKLIAVSFFSACCVALLHAFEPTMSDTGAPVTAWTTTLLSRIMTSFAVPLFFVISGYLFAVKTDLGRKEKWYPALLKKRTSSLLLPYLAWCTIYAVTSVPFAVLGNHMAGRDLAFNTCLTEPILSFRNVCRIYGLHLPTTPSGTNLWYIRNLLLLFVLTPLIMPVMKRRSTGLAFLFLAFFANLFHDWFPRSCWQVFQTGFSLRGILFFPLGVYFAFYPVKPGSFRTFRRLSTFLWLALSIVATWFLLYPGSNTQDFERILLKIVELVGVCAVWSLPDIIPAFSRLGDYGMAKDSFFVYVAHYGILLIVMCGRVAELLETKLHVPVLGVFFLRFIIPLGLSLLAAEFLKRFFPGLYRFFSGGR